MSKLQAKNELIAPVRPVWLKAISLISGLILACGFVVFLDRFHDASVQELKLGQLGEDADPLDKVVLCTDLVQSDLQISKAKESEGQRMLWLGNSQLPTINQWTTGDRTMVSLLHSSLQKNDWYVFGCAPPNSNLQEHLVLSSYFVEQLRPSILLLPVFFDDLRETGIRPQLNPALEDEKTRGALAVSDIGQKLVDEFQASTRATTPAPTSVKSTLDWSEENLNQWLADNTHYWEKRGTYRSVLFVQMYLLRNSLLGIKANSIRRMIPERYERNMLAFDAILKLAASNDVRVLVYIPPIRNDVPIPYDMDAYQQFKRDIAEKTASYQFKFADLDSLIPTDAWGTKESTSIGGGQEIDFMHFSYRGHQTLAAEIERILQSDNFFRIMK